MSALITATRKAYHGSCHCGLTRYIAYLTLPPAVVHPEAPSDVTRIRKCNCSTCHKTALFHVRLADAPNDFVLLAPANPFEGLSDYTCNEKFAHFFFCSKCGVRCFVFGPDAEKAESVDIDLEAWEGKASQGKPTKIWRPRKEAWTEGDGCYLSINATSLDAGQDGLDLREWHEKGWIVYLDQLDQREDNVLGKPHRGGMY